MIEEIKSYYWTSLAPRKSFSMKEMMRFSKILDKFNNNNRQIVRASDLSLRRAWKNGLIEHQYKNGKKDFSKILELDAEVYRVTTRGIRFMSVFYQQYPRLLLSIAMERFNRLVDVYPQFKHFKVILNRKKRR